MWPEPDSTWFLYNIVYARSSESCTQTRRHIMNFQTNDVVKRKQTIKLLDFLYIIRYRPLYGIFGFCFRLFLANGSFSSETVIANDSQIVNTIRIILYILHSDFSNIFYYEKNVLIVNTIYL